MPSSSTLITRRLAGWLAMALLTTAPAYGADSPAAVEVFPRATVGFLSIDDVPDYRQRWSRTQLGLLSEDPSMQPFLKQLRAQINRKTGRLDERLGVTLEELFDTASGEAAIAVVALGAEKGQSARAVFADVAGRGDEVRQVIAKVEKRLAELGSTRTQREDGLVVHDIPADEQADRPARTVCYFHTQNRLAAADNTEVATAMLARVGRSRDGLALADRPAFAATRDKSTKAAARLPVTVRWYVSPFELDVALDEPSEDDLAEKQDTLELLRNQGFDAITGIGGVVTFAADKRRDFVHHTAIHAPGEPGATLAREKYELAMRMLELPNASPRLGGSSPPVEAWAPRQIAGYSTLHIDVQNAFDHFGSLFDAFAGYDDAFETTLRAFEKDHYGPKINLRNEVIEHLGSRAVIMTDYTLPITPECERYLIVLDVRNESALREPLDKWLENDGANRKQVNGVPYWEIVPEEESLEDVGLDDGLLPMDDDVDWRAEREERVLRRAAVCLHESKLVIGSDVEFLEQAVFGVSPGESLLNSPDLRVTLKELSRVAPGERCGWTFTRTDEALRPSYELVRQGKMPESQTFFGRLLNRLLTTDEEREVDAIRPQKIDGSKLPSFELARRYFGPSARSARSTDDGWMISGVILSKAAQ